MGQPDKKLNRYMHVLQFIIKIVYLIKKERKTSTYLPEISANWSELSPVTAYTYFTLTLHIFQSNYTYISKEI
jgi:hypothetical protein